MTGGLQKLLVKLAGIIIVPLVLGSCASATGPGTGTAGGNPASPPTPPAELPSALRFPETIAEISVSAIVNPGSLPAALAIGDDASSFIEGDVLATIFAYGLADDVLEPLSQLVIPVSLNNQFEGLIVLGNDLVNVKIDFSDYDGRGCSGHTAALPICYRIWYDGERRLFGQFDSFPTEVNAGAGELRGIATADLLLGARFEVALLYDLRDPVTKTVDIAFELPRGSLSASGPRVRVMLDQVPSDDSLLKTFRTTGFNESSGLSQEVSRWIDNQDFWSGTRELESVDPAFNFEAACAVISSGIVVERDECIKRGIDVGDLDFASLPDPLEFAFPPDFQSEPPF